MPPESTIRLFAEGSRKSNSRRSDQPIRQSARPLLQHANLATTAPAGLGTNYLVNLSSRQHNYRYEGRVDYSINATNTLFARYFYTDTFNYAPGTTEKFGGDNQPLANQNFAVNYTRTLACGLANLPVGLPSAWFVSGGSGSGFHYRS